jgi:hypothetical protein
LFSLFPPGFPAVPRYFIHTFDLDAMQTSRSKPQNFRCVDAGLIKYTPPRMEDFTVTCPLVPGVPHLVSGSCASPHIFGLGFLQTPPRGDALALLLAFGCAYTWHGDLHPVSSVPCPAHTARHEPRGSPRRLPGRAGGYPTGPPTDPDVRN